MRTGRTFQIRLRISYAFSVGLLVAKGLAIAPGKEICPRQSGKCIKNHGLPLTQQEMFGDFQVLQIFPGGIQGFASTLQFLELGL